MLEIIKKGHQLQQQGNLPGAERLYRQVLQKEPGNLHGLNLLGALCVNSGRSEEAVKLIGKALTIVPNDPQALVNMALAQKGVGDIDAGIKSLRRSLKLNANNPFALNSLGGLLLESGRQEDALGYYKKALQLDKRYVDCWCNLASVLNALQQYEQGAQAAGQALKLLPEKAQAHYALAEACRGLSHFTRAIEHYQAALKFDPDNIETTISLANTYREADNPGSALAILEPLARRYPELAEPYNALGLLQEQMGQPELAAESFQHAISLAPERAISHYQLAQIKSRQTTDAEAQVMESLLGAHGTVEDDRALLAYALAPYYETVDRRADAFSSWAQANAIRAAKSRYLTREKDQFYDAVVRHAVTAHQHLEPAAGSTDTRPVFIVAMPRSGTTLTGQILSSHSQVASVGEVSFAHDLAEQVGKLTGSPYPAGLERLTAAQCQRLGEEFGARLTPQQGASTYVIDNTPLNFQHLGLLGLVLPKAKFIHCLRDPMDTCFSMFKLPFGDNQNFAHDLESLGQHYCSYWQLMARWKELLPGRILDIHYEQTVTDLDEQSRRMFEFLDLPYEASVQDFHRMESLVRTPSASQVRQPIYTKAVKAWLSYEEFLAPLKSSLQPVLAQLSD
ncbi:MAG: sulfotransferase [Halioglobus sp.]